MASRSAWLPTKVTGTKDWAKWRWRSRAHASSQMLASWRDDQIAFGCLRSLRAAHVGRRDTASAGAPPPVHRRCPSAREEVRGHARASCAECDEGRSLLPLVGAGDLAVTGCSVRWGERL